MSSTQATTRGPLTGLVMAHVGIVVPDLAEAIARYRRTWNIGPWTVHMHDADWDTTYRGEPGRFSMRCALSAATPTVELIEPLTGPSAYSEWFDAGGVGVHHFAYQVDSVDAMAEQMQAAGYELVQSARRVGLDADGAYAYFDTTADIGVFTELYQVAARRREPEIVD